MSAPKLSDLHMSIAILINTFDKYAGRDGNAETLRKPEVKELLQNELPQILGNPNDKAGLDKIFNDLDHDKDGTVDFLEFAATVATIAAICHEQFCSKTE